MYVLYCIVSCYTLRRFIVLSHKPVYHEKTDLWCELLLVSGMLSTSAQSLIQALDNRIVRTRWYNVPEERLMQVIACLSSGN